MPSKQADFMEKLERLIARAKQLLVAGFGEQEPEEATKTRLHNATIKVSLTQFLYINWSAKSP